MPAADRKRYAAYMRVSRVMGREGASYMSPDQQREAIERWAGYRDADVEIADEDWILEEDRSGGTQDRPKLQAIIERIERHELDGLICAKLNRFARSVISAKLDVERILAAEGSIGFVAEDIDPTTRNGRFVLTMFLAIAELELDGIKDGWAEVKLRVAIKRVAGKEHAVRRRAWRRCGLRRSTLLRARHAGECETNKNPYQTLRH